MKRKNKKTNKQNSSSRHQENIVDWKGSSELESSYLSSWANVAVYHQVLSFNLRLELEKGDEVRDMGNEDDIFW